MLRAAFPRCKDCAILLVGLSSIVNGDSPPPVSHHVVDVDQPLVLKTCTGHRAPPSHGARHQRYRAKERSNQVHSLTPTAASE